MDDLLRLLFVLSVSATFASGQNWFMMPYGNSSFNTMAKFNSNVTLECKDSRFENKKYQVEYWITPDLRVLLPNAKHDIPTFDGMASWKVNSNGSAMMIYNVNEKMFGFYHCVINIGGKKEAIKKALDYDGAYYGDLWEDYRMNVIVGVVAGAICAFILIIALLIYYFRFYKPQQKKIIEEKTKERQRGMNGASYGEKSRIITDLDNDDGPRYETKPSVSPSGQVANNDLQVSIGHHGEDTRL